MENNVPPRGRTIASDYLKKRIPRTRSEDKTRFEMAIKSHLRINVYDGEVQQGAYHLPSTYENGYVATGPLFRTLGLRVLITAHTYLWLRCTTNVRYFHTKG